MSAAIVKALSPNLDLVRTSDVKSTVRVTVNLRVHEDDLKLKKPLSYSRAEPFTSLNPFTARVFFMKEFCEATLTFEFVDEILRCDHSNKSSLPVLSHDAICLSKVLKMKFGNLVKICLWPHLAVKGLSTNPPQNHDYIFLIFPVSYLTL